MGGRVSISWQWEIHVEEISTVSQGGPLGGEALTGAGCMLANMNTGAGCRHRHGFTGSRGIAAPSRQRRSLGCGTGCASPVLRRDVQETHAAKVWRTARRLSPI
jgi:hypothetical protein